LRGPVPHPSFSSLLMIGTKNKVSN
jgi:hypothetical protein